MHVDAQVTINGTKAAVWQAITDIEHAATLVRGIDAIELLERPRDGLVGLAWRETRQYFGKPAAVIKRITDAVEREHYTTRAQEGRFVFTSTLRLSGSDGAVTLTSRHETIPQGVLASLQAIPMRLFFTGVIRKALLADLVDLKAAVEKPNG